MTTEEFAKLGVGDIIRHKHLLNSKPIIITWNGGNNLKIGVTTHHITNPHEWELAASAEYTHPPKPQKKSATT